MVQSLRDRIREAEDQAVEKENFANRSDVTISSMRKEMHTLQDRLQQVESSLKHHIAAEEEATSQAKKWESKVCDIFFLTNKNKNFFPFKGFYFSCHKINVLPAYTYFIRK